MKYIAIDIETTGLRWDVRLLLVGYCLMEDGAIETEGAINLGFIDMFHPISNPVQARAELADAISKADWIVFHNGSFDIPLLVKHQIISIEQIAGRVFDTLVMSRCTGSHDSVSLKSLVSKFDIQEVINDPAWSVKEDRKTLEKIGVEKASAYVALDCVATCRVFERIYPLAYEYYGDRRIAEEGDFVLEVSKMRIRGIRLNTPKIRGLIQECKRRQMEILQFLAKNRIRSGNDTKGLLKYLAQNRVAHCLLATDRGNPQMDEKSLQGVMGIHPHVDEVVSMVLEDRDLSKMRATWLEGFLDHMDGEERIHPLLSVGGTVSFRLSCTEPNAQAVRRDLGIFTSRPGYTLVELDYSQAELRAGAAYARENVLAEMFHNQEDVHLSTAKLMFGEEDAKNKRRLAKTANFGAFYGGGAPALDSALGCGMDMAQHIVDLHRKTFPGVRSASKTAEKRWRERGYVVASHGKRIYASPRDLENRIYKAYNALIQSSIAEIIRVATLEISRTMPDVLIVLQVHDSLYVEIPSGDSLEDRVQQIKDIMRESGPTQVLNGVTPPIEMVVDSKIIDEGQPLADSWTI